MNTTASEPRSSQICMQLASDTIEAVLAYMKSQANPIPFGLNAIECVVESICHLVPHVRSRLTDEANPQMLSFGRAIEFLQDLSNTLGAARRALDALGEIADERWLNVLDTDGGFSLDYMPLFSNISKEFRQESFYDPFSSESSETWLPGPDIGLF